MTHEGPKHVANKSLDRGYSPVQCMYWFIYHYAGMDIYLHLFRMLWHWQLACSC